jgi:hypothetical protein
MVVSVTRQKYPDFSRANLLNLVTFHMQPMERTKVRCKDHGVFESHSKRRLDVFQLTFYKFLSECNEIVLR